MWTYLTRNLYPARLCFLYDVVAFLGGAMAKMKCCACLLRKHNVSHLDYVFNSVADSLFAHGIRLGAEIHNASLHKVDILTMSKDRNICLGYNLHRLTIQA